MKRFWLALNWRHKAGLFLTLAAVGCVLMWEPIAMKVAGFALVGIAFSWLIGSLSPRTLGVAIAILMSVLGNYIAAAPIWSDWNSTTESAEEYDQAIRVDLPLAIKSARVLFVDSPPISADPSRCVWIPNSVRKFMRPESRFTRHNPEVEGYFPQTMSDAEIMQVFKTRLLLPRPTFSFGSAVHAHSQRLRCGFALLTFGMSLLGLVVFRPSRRRQHPPTPTWTCPHCGFMHRAV